MKLEDQSAAIAFLQGAAGEGDQGPANPIETHISVVVLAGNRALKLKRAVRLPYADFSTPEIRLAACEKELALNRRTTPDLYLGVRRITREADGRLTFDGHGTLVDAVVEMKRFEQDCLFDRMAERGALTEPLMRELAGVIAASHVGAKVVRNESGAANIAGVLDINRAGFGESHLFCQSEVVALDRAFRAALKRHAPRLDARARAGWLRHCHGDLHLRNICLLNGRPRLFDCIDFNDRLATVDVLYDLAFLAMDLWHRGLHTFANLLVNQYADEAGEEDGFALLSFFTALRAAVRAHVTATQAETAPGGKGEAARRAAREYFELASAILRPCPARLVAIGGLSGSGKSTLAVGLAPWIGAPPGARLIESDRVRKAMFGVTAETRLPAEAYARDVSDRVYETMTTRAYELLASGASVVADAVYDRPKRREEIALAADAANAPFDGVWLDVDPEALRKRVAARCGGVSDATSSVLEAQLSRDLGPLTWMRLAASGSMAETLRVARATLNESIGSSRD
jgi:aminoglycoside phosphotransferase family enzyme/predicted kinase